MNIIAITTALIVVAAPLSAQVPAAPTGHWEGAIQVPNKEVQIAVDLMKNADGALAATFTRPGGKMSGFPLMNVAVTGKSVRFDIVATAGGGAFDGTLSDDAKTISGTFNTAEGGYSIPFSLTRTGEPIIAPPIRNSSVGNELEGTWNGTLDLNGKPSRLVLTLANQRDGTAKADMTFLDLAGMTVGIGIEQKASSVTLELKPLGGSFAGTLNAGGTEIAGAYSTEGITLPLTLRRATPLGGKP
jgi:hypothetical protein